jgi:hypothetical protein
MVSGTSDVDEALAHLTRVLEIVTENEWSIKYAAGISREFGSKISASSGVEELENFAVSLESSNAEVKDTIMQILEIEAEIPRILKHYSSLSDIGDAWMSSIGQDILNRKHTMSYYQ